MKKDIIINNLKVEFDLWEDWFSFCVPEIWLFTEWKNRDELTNSLKEWMSLTVKKWSSAYKKLNKFFRFDPQYVAK